MTETGREQTEALYREKIGPGKYAVITKNRIYVEKIETDDDGNPYPVHQYDVIKGEILPRKRMLIDDHQYWEVKTDDMFRGDARELVKMLERMGKVTKRSKAQDCVNIALQGMNTRIVYGHATYGVYPLHDDEDKMEICVDPYPLTDEHEKVIREIERKGALEQEMTKENLKAWLKIFEYWHPYEILPVMGLAAIAPFAYILRARDMMVPHLYHYSPQSGIGKTETGLLASKFLYGRKMKTANDVESKFRYSATIDSFGGPILADEATSVNKQGVRDLMLSTAERPNASSRGTRDLGMVYYLSRAVLIFTGNKFPFKNKNILVRLIKNRFDMDAWAMRNNPQRQKEYKQARKELQPIGFRLAETELPAMDWSISRLVEEIDKHGNIIYDKVNFDDSRRPVVWGVVYEGLKIWERAAAEHGIDWQAPSYEEFKREVIAPIEADTFESLEMPAENVLYWWYQWKVKNKEWVEEIDGGRRQKVKGMGETWEKKTITLDGQPTPGKATSDIKGDVITSSILNEYQRDNRGMDCINNMSDLGEGIAALLGIPKKDVYKRWYIGDKTRVGVFLPHEWGNETGGENGN